MNASLEQVANNTIKKGNESMLITLHGCGGFINCDCLFLLEMFWKYFCKILQFLLFQLNFVFVPLYLHSYSQFLIFLSCHFFKYALLSYRVAHLMNTC